MSANLLEKDIQTSAFKPCYLLFGTEAYLKRVYGHRLLEALLPREEDMNLARFSGENTDWEAVAAAAATVPFFAERRVIYLQDTGCFQQASEEALAVVKEAPATTVFLFEETGVDKRNRLYKYAAREGRACEYTKASEEDLIAWIAGWMKKQHIKITKAAAQQLIFRMGTEMDLLEREMEKLAAYALESQEITVREVEAIASQTAEDHVFQMIDALSTGDTGKMLSLYWDAISLKVAPLKILSLIHRHYRILLVVKNAEAERKNKAQTAQLAGVAPYFVSKYQAMARRLSEKDLRAALFTCANLEEAIKSGAMEDTVGVELFLTGYRDGTA